jgi:hypothetical protein
MQSLDAKEAAQILNMMAEIIDEMKQIIGTQKKAIKALPVLSEEQVYSLYHYILDQPNYKPIDSCILDWVEQQISLCPKRPEHLRKPKMIMCNGFEVADGDSSFCVGDNFYLPYVSSGLFYEEGVFTGHSYDRMVVSKGIAYRTKEGAVARAKAMLGINPRGDL